MLFKDDTKKSQGTLGSHYRPGEVIIRQGDPPGDIYVVLEGRVEVMLQKSDGSSPKRMTILEKDDLFGEVSIFDHLPRTASVYAIEDTRVLTLDQKGFVQHIQEDPSMALRLLKQIGRRTRRLNGELLRLYELLDEHDIPVPASPEAEKDADR
ncbi:MAG: cyclic nucleotide-binding domain-containing protein [Magnetococcales bacterium]|nr:cyclic nucleotide-binding domain-containing protein [Magnetococcales bacterium]